MKVGVILPYAEREMGGETPRWSDILAMARTAEAIGLDSIWISDHLLFRSDDGEARGTWECWSLVSALAAATDRIEIGTYVNATSFRNPALFAKMIDTVEEISGGRLIVGLGAGWHEPEYQAFGFPFDHRVSRFEEAIHIIATLLRDGAVDFDGAYYRARDCELRPRGPRLQGPPLMVGSTRPRMLRLAGRYADLWNGYAKPIDVLPELNAKVDAACADVGRDPATLGRTAETHVRFLHLAPDGDPGDVTGDPDEIAGSLAPYAGHGLSHLQLRIRPDTLASIEAFAPVLAALDRRLVQAPDGHIQRC
jgi:alkanesulfonate monooxygenase SsuD/methylene tetrahydromethanopterin reductase-like flavin-dependent oxidoreductase (luciferase family)